MESKHYDTIEERHLFYSIPPEMEPKVCLQGFSSLTTPKNGHCNEGIYFSCDARLSHHRAKSELEGNHCMLYVRVLVGCYVADDSNPCYKERVGYQTKFNERKSNTPVFVVFNPNQVYPEYIIRYRSLP